MPKTLCIVQAMKNVVTIPSQVTGRRMALRQALATALLSGLYVNFGARDFAMLKMMIAKTSATQPNTENAATDEATHRHLLRSGDRPGGTGYPVSRGWEPDTRSWAARHSRLGIGTERVADRRKRRARGLAQRPAPVAARAPHPHGLRRCRIPAARTLVDAAKLHPAADDGRRTLFLRSGSRKVYSRPLPGRCRQTLRRH